MSDEQPSAQIELTASRDDGIWGWANLNTVSDAYGGAELGLGIGYTRQLGSLETTLGVVRYFYPGEENIDYSEIDLSAAMQFGKLTINSGVEYTPAQDHYAESDLYTWLGFEFALPHDIAVHGQVGQDDGIMAPTPYAIDYSVGIGVPFGALNVDLSFIDAETEAGAVVLRLAYQMPSD